MNNDIPSRWTQLRYHPEQARLWGSSARFNVVSAGRRSGKTELAKRDLVKSALSEVEVQGARFLAAAPTLAQAKEIFWDDLRALVPPSEVVRINHTDLRIELVNDARLLVRSMDKPERIEGSKLRKIVIDEIANCRPDTWKEHVRPCLSTEDCIGSAWLIGVPEGRNFFYKLAKKGQAGKDGYDHFTWFSSDIIPASEIAAARSELDPLTYQQEYEGSFITFEGRAYYGFGKDNLMPLKYDPKLDLVFCFDFNIKPGVAAVVQEQMVDGVSATCAIGEVWIPQNSNTPAVCRKLAAMFKGHEQRVRCYGDPTGGNRGSAKVHGTDWDIVEEELRRAFKGVVMVADEEFSQVTLDVSSHTTGERPRVNALNARILAADGTRRLFVDPQKAPHIVEDLEGVRLLEGGSGELDKKSKGANQMLTHVSDAVGYYVERKFPLGGGHDLGYEQLY